MYIHVFGFEGLTVLGVWGSRDWLYRHEDADGAQITFCRALQTPLSTRAPCVYTGLLVNQDRCTQYGMYYYSFLCWFFAV